MNDESIIDAAKEYEKSTCFGDIVLKAKGVNSAAGIGFLEGAVWARKQIMEDTAFHFKLLNGWLKTAGKK